MLQPIRSPQRPYASLAGFSAAFLLILATAGCGGGSDTCKGAGCVDTGGGPSDTAVAQDTAADVTPVDAPPSTDVGETVTGEVCTTGQTNGCADSRNLIVCAPDGNSWVNQPCFGAGQNGVCLNGACTVCVPGATSCDAAEEKVVKCREDGSGFDEVEDCNGAATGRICSQGQCTRLCTLEIKFKDYMGCRYWAADLDNAFVACGGRSGYCDAQGAPFAIVVSNPHPEWPAEVTIWEWDEDAGNEVEVLYDRDGLPFDRSPIRPGELRIYQPAGNDINGTEIARKAYRVEASIPITAYQFNPLENVDVFSNDASLLIPSTGLGRYYFVMTREQTFDQLRGYLTVIAAEGTTRVNVTVTASTEVSADGTITHMEPGGPDASRTFTLQAYDVLNIETNEIGADLTGSVILADKPVAVFGGSEAANAPNTNHCVANPTYDPGVLGSEPNVCEGDMATPCDGPADCSFFITCCADHLEEQLFPVKTWGDRYLATRHVARGNESDNWRILASEDGTRVTTLPPILSIPVLNKGEWFDFETQQDFEIASNKPILVGQFMQAEQAPEPGSQPGDAKTGDPAFLLAVPIEQFREDYVFLAPNKYEYDYVTIVAPRDATVQFDGAPLRSGQFESFGTGEYKVARFLIQDGVHRVNASAPVGVSVYGYDQYVSYSYPAGLNLTDLRDDPEFGSF